MTRTTLSVNMHSSGGGGVVGGRGTVQGGGVGAAPSLLADIFTVL
jgi:hypothetical protein